MSDEHVSDLRWDRLLAGELATEQATEVRAHAASCARCGARLAELTAGRDAFEVPLQVIPLAPRRKRGVWIGAAATAIAAAAVILLVVRPREPGERRKGLGDTELVLEVSRAPLSTGDPVFAGDELQAGYSSTVDGFGAVIARDGAGDVFAYVPSSGDTMLALPAGERRSFPQSTKLDDVLGRERVFVVWCETPHPIAPLVAELRTTGEIAGRAGCALRRIDLEKRARP